MPYDIPVDYQTLINNKCSGSEYAVYLYVKHRLIADSEVVGLSLSDIKRGYDQAGYAGLRGISRDEIRDDTGYTLKQVNSALEKLQKLDLLVPDLGDNGRYYYQIHFRLPFIQDKSVDPTKLPSIR